MLVVTFGLACGPDDDSGGPEDGVLQISIDFPTTAETFTLGSSAAEISIGGSVSESPYGKVAETACNCWGFGCLFDPQCITLYYPRVDVTVRNSVTGQTVPAMLNHNPNVQGETSYSWHATVSVAPGTSRLVSSASDGRGHAGSDSLTITNP